MGLLVAALGATLAAIVESSVLTQLLIGGVKPDLVLSLGLAMVMVLGFEHGMVWAVVGGLLLDFLLPERAIGSTTLALLLVTGAAILVARLSEVPRLPIIALTVFILTFLYQALLMLLLAVTTGSAIQPITVLSYAFIALMNTGIAVVAAWLVMSLERRLGVDGRVVVEDTVRKFSLQSVGNETAEVWQAGYFNDRDREFHRTFDVYLDALLTAFKQGQPPPVHARAGKRALQLAYAAIESFENGRRVDV